MTIKCYREQPFDSSTEVDPVDLFTGDGSTQTFTLSNKTGLRLGAAIQFDSTVYYRYNGGFTVSGNNFTTSSPPADTSTGVAPGMNCIALSAFDVATVPGVTDPLEKEVAFYIGNGSDIYLEYYSGVDGTGLQLQFVTLIDLNGQANADWLQLASSTQDAAGIAATYQATGEAIYLDPISQFGLTVSSMSALGTELVISSSDTWITGDYILINPGASNAETFKMTDQSGSPYITFTTSELNYAHYVDEPVFACARKVWAKLTVPEDAASNVATNYLNVALNCIGITYARF